MSTRTALGPRFVTVAWSSGSLVALTAVSLTVAAQVDETNYGSPVSNGTLTALSVLFVLVFLAGVALGFRNSARDVGSGLVIGTALATPVAILIASYFVLADIG